MAPHALKTPRTGTFAKTDRLRKRREFLSVYEIKRSYFFRLFVVYVRENGLGRHRLGLTVSKKVGGSVVRNRVKRATTREKTMMGPGDGNSPGRRF